tara:strand:- start:197 stop:352 length:156 start_codon:yes stop_codon:yes gene_type:complete
MNKYSFIGVDDNEDIKVRVETDKLYTSENAWSMNFKLGQLFPELTFDYFQA